MNGYPDNNPKTAIGATKVPLHLVPPAASHFLALAMADGAKKYGPYNWRTLPVSVSPYKAAAQRHWDAFWDGEDNATDSGVHHLAHAMACAAILLDAMSVGNLVDDRPVKGAAARLQAEYANKDKEVTPIEREGPIAHCTAEWQHLYDAAVRDGTRFDRFIRYTPEELADPVVQRGVLDVQKDVRPEDKRG